MNLFVLSVISGCSIVIAVVIGLVRFKSIHKSYRPFIIICCVGLVTEIAGTIAAYISRNNSIPYNIYAITESLLYLWLFWNWGEFHGKVKQVMLLGLFLVAVWTSDNLVFHSIHTINPLFWIIYSFTLIFLSINQLNRLLFSERGALLKNARFLICMGIVIFYSYTATIEVFYILELNLSDRFFTDIYLILELLNFIINLVFALAVLWIPTKQRFILPFS